LSIGIYFTSNVYDKVHRLIITLYIIILILNSALLSLLLDLKASHFYLGRKKMLAVLKERGPIVKHNTACKSLLSYSYHKKNRRWMYIRGALRVCLAEKKGVRNDSEANDGWHPISHHWAFWCSRILERGIFEAIFINKKMVFKKKEIFRSTSCFETKCFGKSNSLKLSKLHFWFCLLHVTANR
jgi:hypothetical protein